MQNTNIFSRIESLDSMKQEKLFLIQKYRNYIFKNDELKEFIPNLDFNKEKIDIFELYELTGKNEILFTKIINKRFLNETQFDINGKQLSFEELKKKGFKSKLQQVGLDMKINSSLIVKDILKYFNLLNQITSKEGENILLEGENIQMGALSKYYSKAILKTLLDKKRQNKYAGEYTSNDIDLSTNDLEVLGLESKDILKSNKEIQDISWKYDFFKLVQKSVDMGYVFSYREFQMIIDIVNDLKSGKVVLLTGDTGSGKTELARFISKEFISGDYIFVSGSKDKEESDFTFEKVVTSKSMISNHNDNIVKGKFEKISDINKEKQKNARNIFDNLCKGQDLKQFVINRLIVEITELEKKGVNQEEIDNKKKYLEEIKKISNSDLLKQSLHTEIHWMGIYEAAEAGVPCIIDEVNIIRPEVFMALNDLLTRRPGDAIQTSNGLDNINVKPGFCIILTGNDPDQNNKSDKYKSGRYNFDEASYNRLRVYAKNYFNQTIETHKENRLDELDKTYEYLNDNELYGVILMMMFKESSNLNTTGKYGFEIMKRNFEGNNVGKNDFFETIKNFSYSISMIQKAFAGETLVLSANYGETLSKGLNNLIKRKVFSMRNLIEVLEAYKEDVLPLDFHIYNEFIKHTTNIDEKYALLAIFHNFGFFGNLVTDNLESSIKNIEKWVKDIRPEGFILFKQDNKNSDINSKKLAKINKLKNISLSDIENKFVVTKQDLYREYFGSMELNDDFFDDEKENITNQTQYEADIDINEIDSQIEISSENLIELIGNIQNKINEKTHYLSIDIIIKLGGLLEILRSLIYKNDINDNKFSQINSILIKMYNILNKLGESDYGLNEKELEKLLLGLVKNYENKQI